MKNTITLEQFRRLETLVWETQEKNHPDREDDYLIAMLTTAEGDGPEDEESAVMACLGAYDWDGNTDFSTLQKLLAAVGVELDESALESPFVVGREQNAGEWEPRAYWSDGDASWGRGKNCRCYYYNLMLAK